MATNCHAQCWIKIASKYENALAIKADSSLWNWGGNNQNEKAFHNPTLIDSNSNWSDVATGERFYAAINSNGTLWTWGENIDGQIGNGTTTNLWTPTQLGTDSSWLDIECGSNYMLAIKNDGTLWTWGKSRGLSPTQIGSDTNWVKIASGINRSLGVKVDQSLWGIYTSSASLLNNGLWKTISAGNSKNHGIMTNGTLWEWGNGLPVQLGTETNWKKVSDSYDEHSLFIKTNGTLWASGDNNYGQLGNNTIANSTAIIQVGTDDNWGTVIAGNSYSLALKTNRSLWAWGKNNHAQFGNGKNKNTPQPIDINTHWKTASTSNGYISGHTLAIKDDGTLWSWGQNNDGQLGNGLRYVHSLLPIQITNDTNWQSVSNGFFFSVAIKTDGTLWTWGRNGRGQLGIGSLTSPRTVPINIGNDSTWSMVSAGAEFVLALKNNGTLWAWGYNYSGELGNGNTTTQFAPIQIGSDTNWSFVNAGDDHSFAIKSDSTLWSWGNNQHGKVGRFGILNTPAQVGTDKWKTVSGGGMHSIGVKADSTLWSWGRNLYAQLGDGGTSNKSTPNQIDTLHHWNNVAAGYEHSVATKLDSSLWGWGRNNAGQVGDTISYSVFLSKTFTPTKISLDNDWGEIDAGTINSIAIKSNGNLYTYGEGYSPTYNTNFPQLGYVFSIPQKVSNCSYCPPLMISINSTICQGDSIFLGGLFQTTNGVYIDTLQAVTSCDSIVTTTLSVNATYTSNQNQTICQGDSILLGGLFQTTNGVYADTLQTVTSCDSIVTTTLSVNATYTSNQNQTICQGDSILLGGLFQTTNGVYVDTLQTVTSCDSIVTTTLSVNATYISNQNQTICQGDSILLGGLFQTTNGVYVDTLQTVTSCDSIVTTTLSVNATYISNQNQTICQGDSILIYGNYQNSTGTYYDSLQTINGCDSLFSTMLTIAPLPNVSIALFNPDTLCGSTSSVTLPNGTPSGGSYTGTGVTGINFNPLLAGLGTHDIIYTFTDGNSCINSDTTIITVDVCTAINNIGDGFGIFIYPNPSTGQFTIEKPSELNKEVQVKLLDPTSKLILEKIIPKGNRKIEIDIRSYSNGVYYLQLNVDDEQFVKRILKN
jgi:alpha-tubulin suppressor-like RCC1 family protein